MQQNVHAVAPPSAVSRGIVLAVLAAAGFSAKAIFIKLAYQYQVDPLTLLTLRMLFALPFFLLMVLTPGALRAARSYSLRTWLALVLLGGCGYYLSSLFDFLGLQYISSALERLVLYLYPTFVLLLAVLCFGRRIGRREWLALALCYGGIGLAVAHDLRHAFNGDAIWLGVAWVLASAVSYAVYLTGAGELVKRIGSVRMAAWGCLFSTAGIVIHFLVTRDPQALLQPWPVYGYGLAMAVISTVLPVVWMNIAMTHIGASRMAMVSTLGPAITLVLGWLVLGDAMSGWQIAGALLVVGGVIMVNQRK
ncbi:DMT family transporter [Microvirgula aerodenitrificans]|uniref:DMT family transporter n=1 Tax=Microvirgula aerodenitrificans TaxID=57480 RepID=UPI00248F0D5E|nr:DMT family transporter [Microvirgula aerodenitrificans]